jgi:hypothetical protein
VSASFVVEERSAIPVFSVQRAAADQRLEVIRDRVRSGIDADPRIAFQTTISA